MIYLVYVIWLCLYSFQQDPPVKLIAFKQPVSKAIVKPEIYMDGDLKTEKNKLSYNYLIWLATDHPATTNILAVKVNDKLITFDTAHFIGKINIEDGVKAPLGDDNQFSLINSGSYIRIYLKGDVGLTENQAETIVIRFKESGKCRKKINKPIKLLQSRVTE